MEEIKSVLSFFLNRLGIVYLAFFITLFCLSIRKCFWKGGKSGICLFFLTLFTNPFTLYCASFFSVRLLLSVIFQKSVISSDSDYDIRFVVLSMSISTVIYIVLIFLLSDLFAKWLNALNRKLVTYVFLMFSVIVSISVRKDLTEFDNPGFFDFVITLALDIILYVACILMYRFVITALSALTDKRRKINTGMFLVPPVIFTLLYNVISVISGVYADKRETFLIILFSNIIVFLFIWAFYVIIDNINATNEAIEAKDLAAEMAASEARIEADLSIARSIQTSALPCTFPPFPDRREFELFASMNTAKEVGGDFYDFYLLEQDTLGFLIADVSGKGIPAAMFMMTGKTIIKGLAENRQSPAEIFTVANEKLCEGNDAELFITAWLGSLDLKTGMVHVANAGHNPPVLIRDGKAEYVVFKPGLMLAGMDGMVYKDQTLQLQKNDILYLYTDGVTEAMDVDENQYGEDRLIDLLSFGDNYPEPSDDNGIAGAVCEMVKSDIDNFVNGAEQSDDITMLCVRFMGIS